MEKTLERPLPRGDAAATKAEYESGKPPIHCSGWTTVRPHQRYGALQQDIHADVAVIGAGLAGSSVALHLAQLGASVALIEARQPGDGASGRNAGHVQPFLDHLEYLKDWPNAGQDFIQMFIEQRNIVFDLCEKYRIDADALKSGMVEAALKPQKSLAAKARYWRSMGYAVEELDATGMRKVLGTGAYQYGLHWSEGGRVNPYLLTNGMVAAAAGLGAKVFGDSPVLQCHRDGALWRVATAQGSVRAGKVIICTSGHDGNGFFPGLAATSYPLVACAVATRPVPKEVLDSINPTRAAVTQFPTGLYPIVMDGSNRMISATIPHPGRASEGAVYFNYFLNYLHKTFPQTRDVDIQMESYWTGVTASSSHVYHADYPNIFQLDDGVMALSNLGTWGNIMGPLLGRHLAQVVYADRPQDLLLPWLTPQSRTVRHPDWFSFKVRRFMLPAARLVDKLGLA